jgi:hypothetical protein
MKFIRNVIFVVIITGCSSSGLETRDDIFKKNLISYLKNNMHDPTSLEIIEINLIDSVTYLNNIKHRKSKFIGYKEFAESQIEYYKNRKYYDQEEYKQYLKDIEKENWVIHGNDSIAKAMGENVNAIASFMYTVTLRGKNAFGGKTLSTIYVQTTSAPDYKVHHIAYDYGDIDLSPNNFPGYIDLVLRSKEKFE